MHLPFVKILLFLFLCLGINHWIPTHAQTQSWIAVYADHSRSQSVWRFEQIEMPEHLEVQSVRDRIQDPDLQWVEPNHSVQAMVLPNDPHYAQQWALRNVGQNGGIPGADLLAEIAWDTQRTADSIVVGILDSGIDWQHPDLVHNLWQNLAEDADGDGKVLEWNGTQWIFDPGDENGIDDDQNGYIDDFIGWDFVNNDNNPSDDHFFGHGTHVAGIIGAEGNNGIGITGVSWQVQIMGLKFLNPTGTGYTSDAIEALQYALGMGAHLSNHSWGGSIYSQAFDQVVQQADQQGHMLIAAAGNNFGNDNDLAPLFPASLPHENVFSVGASNEEDIIARFSNIGMNSVDLFAPGRGIFSTLPQNRYGYLSGTSMAAPFVSGALALLYSQRGVLPPVKTKEILLRAVKPVPSMYKKSLSGGRLDLSSILQSNVHFQQTSPRLEVAGAANAQGNWLKIGEKGNEAWVGNYDGSGHRKWEFTYSGVRFHSAQAHGDRWYIAGNTINSPQQGLLIVLDNTGQLLWNRRFQSITANQLETLAINELGIWLAGTLFSPIDTSIWLSKLDFGGQSLWTRQYFLSGQDWYPHALVLGPDPGAWFLGRADRQESLLLHIDSQGIAQEAYGINHDTAQALLPVNLQLSPGTDQLSIAFQAHRTNGEQAFLLASWERDDHLLEEGQAWYVPQSASPSPSGKGAPGPRGEWILSSSAHTTDLWVGILNQGRWFAQTLYQGASTQTVPQWITWKDGAGLSLGIQEGASHRWIKTDLQGRTPCFASSAQQSVSKTTPPTLQAINPSSTLLNWSLDSLVLTAQIQQATDSIVCDDSDCEVSSYFRLASSLLCPMTLLSVSNLSSQATSYQWWLDDSLISTDANPTYLLPEDEGYYRLRLFAEDGSCVDTFGLTIQIEEEPQLASIDTLHCGPFLWLSAPIQKPGYQYLWLDSVGNILSDKSVVQLTFSGEFELSVTNACGEIENAEILVQLMPGCLWPGDVDADGVVSLQDYLLIGMAHNSIGSMRHNASTLFTPQIAPAWNQQFPTTHPLAPQINYSFADANGDGQVDIESDGLVVKQNFQAQIPGTIADTSPTVVELVYDQNSVFVGDTAYFDILVENIDSSALHDLYGITITLSYDLPLTQPIQFYPDSSLLGNLSEIDTLIVLDQANRKLYLGMTRLDQTGQSGSGMLVRGGVTVYIDDIGVFGALQERAFLTLTVSQVELVRSDGSEIAVHNLSAQGSTPLEVKIQEEITTNLEPPLTQLSGWKYGPNPTREELWLYPPKDFFSATPLEASLWSNMGQQVWAQQLDDLSAQKAQRISFPQLPSGYYWLRFSNLELPSIPLMIR